MSGCPFATGRVTVGGIDLLANPEEAKRRIGYVPDRPFLYEKLRGSEFVGLMARKRNSSTVSAAGSAPLTRRPVSAP